MTPPLFEPPPDVPPAAAGKVPNDLTKPERDALVCGGEVRGVRVRGVLPLCKKLAADHARRVAALRGRRFDPEELESEALVAVSEAAVYWNPAAGAKFSTYAHGWATKALMAATDERASPDVRCGDLSFVAAAPAGADPYDGGDGRPRGRTPNEEQAWLLNTLPEPAREVVRLVAFDGLTPDQAAERVGRAVKDVKLILRNSHAWLCRVIDLDDLANLFAETGGAA